MFMLVPILNSGFDYKSTPLLKHTFSKQTVQCTFFMEYAYVISQISSDVLILVLHYLCCPVMVL